MAKSGRWSRDGHVSDTVWGSEWPSVSLFSFATETGEVCGMETIKSNEE